MMLDSDQNILRQKKERTIKAIKDGGYYGKNGVWNSIVTFPNDPKLYRERVETIVVRSNKEVYLKRKPDGTYFLPGGSTEKGKTHVEQAIAECQEEAKINVKNIKYSGVTYKAVHSVPEWVKKDKFDIEWQGTVNKVFIAEYDGKYTGHIDNVDMDKFIGSGKWYPIKECFGFLSKEHRDVLSAYIKEYKNKNSEVTEGYVSNYFKNKKLLKNISKNPEIERGAVEELVSLVSKKYHKLSGTSRIRRIRKNPDPKEELFFPVSNIDWSDKCTITVGLVFDDKESSPAAATSTGEFGDIVIVYPGFFKLNKEAQIFCILHEIGHIRLNHLRNRSILDSIFNTNRRMEKMRKGSVAYTELNADLYAALSGGKMYALVDTMKDVDNSNISGDTDYKLHNLELSNRYSDLLNRYSLLKEDSISRYDIACSVLYETIEDIEYLENDSKDMLYTIAYEYTIKNKFKDDPSYLKMESKYKDKQKDFKKKYDVLTESAKEDYMSDLTGLHIELSATKSLLYDSKCVPIKESCCSFGDNELASYVSEVKKMYNIELLDTMEDLADKLRNETGINSSKYLYLIESLTQAQRDKIPTHKFGIEDTRSYPLDTAKHVRSAVTLFNKAPDIYKPELAKKIFNAIKKFNVDIEIGKDTELYKYKDQ